MKHHASNRYGFNCCMATMLRPERLWAAVWGTNGIREANCAKAYFRSLWGRSWSSRRPGWKWKRLAGHLCLWLSGFLKPEGKKNTENYSSWPWLNVSLTPVGDAAASVFAWFRNVWRNWRLMINDQTPSSANEVSTSQDKHLNADKSGH